MTDQQQQLYFDDVAVGHVIPERQHGPFSIVESVRWIGFQENWKARLHYDREHVREHSGQRSFIAAGAYREALIARMLTDWVGPDGTLKKLAIRHTRSTVEGDTMFFSGAVVEKSPDASDPWLTCELEGKNQDGDPILTGRCTVTLPVRLGASAKA